MKPDAGGEWGFTFPGSKKEGWPTALQGPLSWMERGKAMAEEGSRPNSCVAWSKFPSLSGFHLPPASFHRSAAKAAEGSKFKRV